MTQDFGSGFHTKDQVTAWEPGKQIAMGDFADLGAAAEAVEADGAEQANFAFEFIVQGREDGSTVLRFVQSGFTDRDGWEDECNSFGQGWDLFFTPLGNADAWQSFYSALGLSGGPAVGDEVTLTPSGLADHRRRRRGHAGLPRRAFHERPAPLRGGGLQWLRGQCLPLLLRR